MGKGMDGGLGFVGEGGEAWEGGVGRGEGFWEEREFENRCGVGEVERGRGDGGGNFS